MKQQYDKHEIAQLLSKFMAGETSVAEEQMLAQYFRTHEVSEEWTEYKELFALFDSGKVDIELEKPKLVTLRWVSAAACALLLIGFFTMKENGEPLTEASQIAQVSDSVEVKPSVVTPPTTNEKSFAQASPQKQYHRIKRSNVVKPHEENVRYMTDEMVDQLLARNHQARIQQPATDFQEAEKEIKRRGELLTNDLLAFTTNN